ncbi:hypothetical protein GPECTOR_92g604 [Gonium pectorale]|uniref:Ankyrin repeat domain-containing protein n=1 Tax=Gonium pectorale TaxID=33097 RepID=A0A150G0M9_GONPE|nr:hypothetical protein GPECTOR_92g604 [Gonium pectorale]|eukprot:KXZ43381.1 hypothetical protein GPECTOR_92g604 [Gonium pectorale]
MRSAAQPTLVRAAAAGCDLATLQQFILEGSEGELAPVVKQYAMAAAAASRTPDWRAKIKRPQEPDRGVGSLAAVRAAAKAGNAEAVRYRLSLLGTLSSQERSQGVQLAAKAGHLPVLQVFAASGHRVQWGIACRNALRAGRQEALGWMEQLFTEVPQPRYLLTEAARVASGSEQMDWLLGRGCLLEEAAYNSAAEGGNGEALQWLRDHGCPMPVDGSPYIAACENGDIATLRRLSQLGVPWGQAGARLQELLQDGGLPLLYGLLQGAVWQGGDQDVFMGLLEARWQQRHGEAP